MLRVQIKVYLKPPYFNSLESIYRLANIKGYHILLGHYQSNHCLLGLSWKQFKSLFKQNPIKNKEYISNNKNIVKIKVINIEEKE